MKQIVKVESYVPIKKLIEKYNIQTEEDKELLYNRTDLEIVRNYWNGDMMCKQISYQYYDFKKNEWVVLPNPEQPKIDGISINDNNKEEGAN